MILDGNAELAAAALGYHQFSFKDLGSQVVAIDGAAINVLHRDPAARQQTMEFKNPADQVGVGLLPKGFFPFPEQWVQEARYRIGQRVRNRAMRMPGDSIASGPKGRSPCSHPPARLQQASSEWSGRSLL